MMLENYNFPLNIWRNLTIIKILKYMKYPIKPIENLGIITKIFLQYS